MEKKIFSPEDTIDFNGIRIDKFLQFHLKKISRTKLQKLVKEGFVKINKKMIESIVKNIY